MKINMSGVIGWDVLPSQIRDSLEEAKGKDIEVLVSSPGGLVSDALEIFNMLKNYKGHVTATLSGFAMSAASYIPLAADIVKTEDNAVYMIHNVHGGVWGDHNDILHYGTMCKGLSAMLTKAYAKFTGKKTDELAELMDNTSFYYGEEIVEAGFAHELVETETDTDEDTAKAMAQMVFSETTAKLSEDVSAIKKDINRAMALGLERPIEATKREETSMDLKTLKEKHPDLVALIEDEAKQGMEDSLKEARAEGAKAENQRIKDVKAQSVAGCEDLIETLAFDGETTGAEAAMKVVGHVQADQKAKADAFKDEAPGPAPQPANNGEHDIPKEPKTEEQAKQVWDASQETQDEFMGDFDLYKCSVLKADGVVFKTLKNGSDK